jgi:hypothetical protein
MVLADEEPPELPDPEPEPEDASSDEPHPIATTNSAAPRQLSKRLIVLIPLPLLRRNRSAGIRRSDRF